jgi:hypothetical protein
VWQIPWQWLDKCSGKKALAIHGKPKLTMTDKGKTGEEQSQEHVHHFLWHRGGLFTNNSSCMAKQSILHTCVTFMMTAWKCAKTSAQTLVTKQLAVAYDNAMSHTSFFARVILTKNNMTVIPHPPYFSLFPRLKIKL